MLTCQTSNDSFTNHEILFRTNSWGHHLPWSQNVDCVSFFFELWSTVCSHLFFLVVQACSKLRSSSCVSHVCVITVELRSNICTFRIFRQYSKPCLSIIVEQLVRFCATFIYVCNTYATFISLSNMCLSKQSNILASNSKLWRATKSNVKFWV